MIDTFMICNEGGVPYYSRKIGNSHEIDPSLLGGLISAIESLGSHIFQKKIATITFGDDDNINNLDKSSSKIVFINKDLFAGKKRIFFVFMCRGEHSLRLMREISTRIFIEIKTYFRMSTPDLNNIKDKVDKLLSNFFKNAFREV